MSAHCPGGRLKLMGRGPVAVQAAPQPHTEFRGSQRSCLESLGVENEEVREALRQPVDDGHEIALTLAGTAGFWHEARLLDRRRGTGPPGLRLAGLVVESCQRVDH